MSEQGTERSKGAKGAKSPRALAEAELKGVRKLLTGDSPDTAAATIHLQQATVYALLEIADALNKNG